jgi:site-specific DNA-methyltransferase (adenine-specific)
MIAMKEMKDKQYDLAIVDPPYRVDMSSGKSPKNGFKSLAHWDKMKTWDHTRPGKEYFDALRMVSKNQIIWGANYFTENLPASMGWVFWYKLQNNFSFSDGEFAYTSFACKARIFKYGRGMESGFAPGGCASPNIHPTQKPVKLYEWLLKNYAKEGDKIIDTHGGSMSIAIACYNMGFDLDLYEIDKDYFEAGSKRLEEHKRQGRLFEPSSPR